MGTTAYPGAYALWGEVLDFMVFFTQRTTPKLAQAHTQPLTAADLLQMELLQECRHRAEQRRVERIMRPYRLYGPSHADCERAFQDYALSHLRHALGILDALIAETAVGLDVALATFNDRHYRVVSALRTIQPYERPCPVEGAAPHLTSVGARHVLALWGYDILNLEVAKNGTYADLRHS